MKSGKTTGLSGKEMFMFNPSIINQATEDGDDEEGGDFDLNMREKDDDYGVKVGLTKRDCGFCHYYKDLVTLGANTGGRGTFAPPPDRFREGRSPP